MKIIVSLVIFVTMAFLAAGIAKGEVVTVRSHANITINTAATSVDSEKSAVANVTVAGASSVDYFGASMHLQFVDEDGDPVNVQNFKVTSLTHTLTKEGVPVTNWFEVPAGAYNAPGDTNRPDFVVRDRDGVQTSVNMTQVVGTTVSVASKFEALDQVVTLGTPTRPKLANIGDNYRFVRDIVFQYEFAGENFEEEHSEEVLIRVIPNQSGEFSGPGVITLQVSENLTTWFSPPVELPNVVPTLVSDVIALFPKGTEHSFPIGEDRRFYRFIFFSLEEET
jgi:hypothetical protein